MNIVYHCYGSAHSSVVAAAIHLGRLPTHRIPTPEEIIALADFDVARNDSLGHLFYKGKDEDGNNVFTIGMGKETELVKRSIQSLIRLSKKDERTFMFAEALPNINRVAKIGGALSRRYGIVGIGRRLAAKGICQSYEQLVEFVQETKKDIKSHTQIEHQQKSHKQVECSVH